MSCYIILSHVQVQSANCIAGITYGFPAITSFLGFVRALSIKLQRSHNITLEGCAVIAHNHHLLTYKVDAYSNLFFTQTKNPAAGQYQQKNIGSAPPVIEEGKMHLTMSLLMECQGFSGTDDDKINLEEHIKKLSLTHRLAGGVITDIKQVVYENIQDDKSASRCRRRLMPGFILMDRSHYLTEHFETLRHENPNAEIIDAWLDFYSIKYQSEAQLDEDEEEVSKKTKAKWHKVDKPRPGYLIPLMTGYQAISDLYPAGTVKNTRDNETPFRFTEAVYGIGEWLSPHRLTSLESAIWRYHYEEENYYLCKQDAVTCNDKSELSNSIIEDMIYSN